MMIDQFMRIRPCQQDRLIYIFITYLQAKTIKYFGVKTTKPFEIAENHQQRHTDNNLKAYHCVLLAEGKQ